MIDWFTLFLVHGLLIVAIYRLMMDDSVDAHGPPTPPVSGEKSGTPEKGQERPE
jgi:hypothetical protein